jgi:hypothetical protein
MINWNNWFMWHIYSLFNNVLSLLGLNKFELIDNNWMINWKGCGNKKLWYSLRYYPGIFLEWLRKTTNNFDQDSRSSDQVLNPGLPEYDAGVLCRRQWRLVIYVTWGEVMSAIWCSPECPPSCVTCITQYFRARNARKETINKYMYIGKK